MGIAEWLARLFARPAGAADITDVEVGVTATCWECSLCGRAFESVYGPYEFSPHCGARLYVELRRVLMKLRKPNVDWELVGLYAIEFLLCVVVGYILAKFG